MANISRPPLGSEGCQYVTLVAPQLMEETWAQKGRTCCCFTNLHLFPFLAPTANAPAGLYLTGPIPGFGPHGSRAHLQLSQQLCGGTWGTPRGTAVLSVQVGVDLGQGLADGVRLFLELR